MKKKLLQKALLLFLVFPAFQIQAQQWSASATLDVNNVAADVRIGDLWFNGSDGKYIVPKDDINPKTSIFAGGLWYGGLDPGGALKVAASTYSENAFFAGPLDPATGSTDEDSVEDWDRMFEITSSALALHIQDYNDNGVIDGPVPANVLGWPGYGNPEFESIHAFELPDQELAPFVDRDGDGIYEPMEGDFPKMKGEKAIWWVFNDVGTVGPQFTVAQFEFHAMAFAYSSSEDYLNNTTFYDFKIINRAIEDIDSLKVGLWIDADLGCYTDDYIGCSPENDLAYAYNADDFDEDCIVNGYGESIPVVGFKMLKGMEDETGTGPGFSNFMYYSNPNLPGVPPAQGDPNYDLEHYHLLNSTWLDGTPLTQLGDGYNPFSGLPPYPYAYDGADLNGTPWTQCGFEVDPGDHRMIMSSGGVLMEPGDARYFSFAVIWSQDVNYPCPDLTDFFAMSNQVADFYENIGDGLFSGAQEVLPDAAFAELAPNPATHVIRISASSPEDLIERIEFFDAAGQQIYYQSGLKENSINLSTADWPRGVSFYRFWAGGKIQTGKLILQ
ncbi:MAG: T9SS type A sorting domain-containing protein [Bacteroidetes bacterium]|nr:T9SS type A sorting domain-containing protein [Bacteroidota bacterium]